jgi:hypothetical protein
MWMALSTRICLSTSVTMEGDEDDGDGDGGDGGDGEDDDEDDGDDSDNDEHQPNVSIVNKNIYYQ